ncbi:MAG: endolytic transglycosylase MltG [Nitrospira sp.]|nr:endolytic transglycosylase MltG [Nitrospira sp.]MBP6606213.1 endolytic transglycosylase MltG [Nitrospira sp.]HQY57805.1 endolytic transglycosylase MltG [Nitrospira sp.]HRA95849.1 endolytic transglycosylase MltG [Nitrospira sp.]
MMQKKAIMGLVLAAVMLAALTGYLVLRWAQSPAASGLPKPPSHIVLIPEGSTFQQVANILKQEQLIRSRSAFLLLGKTRDIDRKIRPGEYELDASMSPQDILAKLLAGRVVLHPVTIPEGYSLTQIAEVLAAQQVTDTKDFTKLVRDRTFISSLGIEADSLEGYLFPETYSFPRQTKAKEVIKAMVDGLHRVWGAELQEQAARMKLSLHQVLTLASVIEKETGAKDERELIAAVFHNRLRKKIPLQSDPTVIYGLPAFDGNIHKRDLSVPSPYNTYRVQGLPPGPIASPGAQSLRAALFPAQASYLYFVSRNDGTHQFSSTLAEHNQAVEKYQKQYFRKRARGNLVAHGA